MILSIKRQETIHDHNHWNFKIFNELHSSQLHTFAFYLNTMRSTLLGSVERMTTWELRQQYLLFSLVSAERGAWEPLDRGRQLCRDELRRDEHVCVSHWRLHGRWLRVSFWILSLMAKGSTCRSDSTMLSLIEGSFCSCTSFLKITSA
jgi:hypothetical protein